MSNGDVCTASLSPYNWPSRMLDLVRLTPLMELSPGRPEVVIGVVDGPLPSDHPLVDTSRVRRLHEQSYESCTPHNSACAHASAVSAILCARRGSGAPAICPGCTLLVDPIFVEMTQPSGGAGQSVPSARPEELASAVAECVQAGVNLINLSLALVESSAASERAVKEALDWAAKRGVLIVAAAGNDGVVGGSAITRHPGVLPVAACDQRGGPLNQSNVGHAIGRRGLMAPGQGFPIPDVDGEGTLFGGTSAATAFVTGAVALLQSVFPRLSLAVIRQAITGATTRRRTTVVPPVLDAWAAYESLTRIS